MVELIADSPKELLYDRLDMTYRDVSEFRFEHPSYEDPIILTGSDLSTLCNMFDDSAHHRQLSYLESCPADSWGKKKSESLTQKLIPSGLVILEPTTYSQTVYTPSDIAKSGTYIAVI